MREAAKPALEKLDELGLKYYYYEHPLAKTMEDCEGIGADVGAKHFKNIYACDHTETNFFIIIIRADKKFRSSEVSRKLGVSRLSFCTDEMLQRYSVINRGYWERLETGELTREQVMLGRFHEFFESEGLPTDQVKVFNDEYQIRLGDKAFFCDHGDELVKQLKATVKQYAVTNGTTVAQERKLRFSGLDQLLDGVFISEQVGVDKPQKAFFDAVWNEIGSYAPDEVVIVGDSLTSDIRGGKNAGILTCWYNPDHLPNKIEVTPDCTIDNLQDILSYLDESR